MRKLGRRTPTEDRAPASLVDAVRAISRPLTGPADLDPLVARVGDCRCVLLGEATHGTREFYTWRADLTRRLIEEKGFSFVVVEGDWPDCYRLNRYVKGCPDAGDSAREVLHSFDRWPTWMWANEEVADFAEWLRGDNERRPRDDRVGFYGLDVYSLWDSMHQVLGYLRRADPKGLAAAQRAFKCFLPYGEDPQKYARATAWVGANCQSECVNLLMEVRSRAKTYDGDGRDGPFAAEQNALVVRNAEAYYRAMVRGGAESWNVRDRHMAETLDRLLAHHGPGAKAVVWEHNTHVGDARYTDMADAGEVNVGQLAREKYGQANVALVGFGTHRGTVVAGDEWEATPRVMPVPPGRPGSWEDVLHQSRPADQLLIWDPARLPPEMADWRGHRAVGVVYHPEYEQYGNYVPTVLPLRYDAFLFVDETRAVRPLHVPADAADREPADTFPFGV